MQSEDAVWLVLTVVVLNGQTWQSCALPEVLLYEPLGHGMQLSKELAPMTPLKKPDGQGVGGFVGVWQ